VHLAASSAADGYRGPGPAAGYWAQTSPSRYTGGELSCRIDARWQSFMTYNGCQSVYNRVMESRERVMTVSRNGQVSIPAETRARWNTRQVVVVDLGDRVVMRPLSENPVAALKGKYAGRGPSSDAARTSERRSAQGRGRS
jgi:AbrB family looped-hinge helix DNA binding protein